MELNHENFEEEVLKSEIPVMVEFWGSWCPPCKMMEPLLKELQEEYGGKIKIKKINTDKYPNIANQFNIQGLPNFILFKEGKEVSRKVASQTKNQLTEFLQEVLR